MSTTVCSFSFLFDTIVGQLLLNYSKEWDQDLGLQPVPLINTALKMAILGVSMKYPTAGTNASINHGLGTTCSCILRVLSSEFITLWGNQSFLSYFKRQIKATPQIMSRCYLAKEWHLMFTAKISPWINKCLDFPFFKTRKTAVLLLWNTLRCIRKRLMLLAISSWILNPCMCLLQVQEAIK